jgi:hypothetical protein
MTALAGGLNLKTTVLGLARVGEADQQGRNEDSIIGKDLANVFPPSAQLQGLTLLPWEFRPHLSPALTSNGGVLGRPHACPGFTPALSASNQGSRHCAIIK